MKKDLCSICGCAKLKPRIEVKGDHVSTCQQCGFMFVSCKTSDSDYSGSYDRVPKPSKFLKKRHFDLIEFLKKTGASRFLEIGSGFGGLAFLCRLEGISYVGVEPDSARQEFLESISINNIFGSHGDVDGSFDFILLDNVLEHVESPKMMLLEISKLLSKDGKLLVIVPNRHDVRRISKRWRLKNFWIPHDHLSFFRSRDIEAILADSGLKLYSRFNYGSRVLRAVKRVFQTVNVDVLALSLVFIKK